MFENLFENINEKYLGFFHVFFSVFVSLYGIFFKKSRLDYIYILYSVFVVVTWTFYNGECLVTYYIKKKENKNYNAGEESTDMKDMYLLFGSKNIVYAMVTFFVFVNSISVYIVLKRNNYPSFIYYSFPIVNIMYTLAIRISTFKLHENKIFLFFQEIVKVYVIFILLLILKVR